MTIITWSWIFLVGYIGLMVGIGVYAQRKVRHADDFATARGAGPFLARLAWLGSKRNNVHGCCVLITVVV